MSGFKFKIILGNNGFDHLKIKNYSYLLQFDGVDAT